MIPKIIHRSWYTRDLPEPIQSRYQKMLDANPDYTQVIHVDSELRDFVHTNFDAEIIKTYESLDIIVSKVDFWRYLKLYHEGGIYLDMDSIVEGPISDFLRPDDEALITAENNQGKFVQWALFFAKGHPILERTIEYIVENVKKGRFKNDILNLTGPNVYSRAILDHHRVIFGRHLNDGKPIDVDFNERYGNGPSSYRVFSIDYRGHCTFKFPESGLLYLERKHWRDEQAERIAKEPLSLAKKVKKLLKRLLRR